MELTDPILGHSGQATLPLLSLSVISKSEILTVLTLEDVGAEIMCASSRHSALHLAGSSRVRRWRDARRRGHSAIGGCRGQIRKV